VEYAEKLIVKAQIKGKVRAGFVYIPDESGFRGFPHPIQRQVVHARRRVERIRREIG
jgi:hypothetical protein